MTGEELRTIRQRLALTQAQFAEQLGLHTNTIARFERGELNISGPVAKLARLLLEVEETRMNKPSKQNHKKEDNVMKRPLRKKRKEE